MYEALLLFVHIRSFINVFVLPLNMYIQRVAGMSIRMTVYAPRTNNYICNFPSAFRRRFVRLIRMCASTVCRPHNVISSLRETRPSTDDASTNTNMSTNIHISTHTQRTRFGSGVRESSGKSKSAIVVVVVYAPRIPYKCFAQKTVIQVKVIFCKTNAPFLLLLALLIVLHISIRNVQAKRNNNKKKTREKIKL